MRPIAVTQKLWIMPQPSLDEFKSLADQGFVTLVNNRPDGEDPTQPGSAAEESAARAAGLSYVHIPVTSTGISPTDIREFREAIAASPGPVVAHCRSGARAFFLWLMGDDLEHRTDDEILTVAEELHLDPKAVTARLDARRRSSIGETQ